MHNRVGSDGERKLPGNVQAGAEERHASVLMGAFPILTDGSLPAGKP